MGFQLCSDKWTGMNYAINITKTKEETKMTPRGEREESMRDTPRAASVRPLLLLKNK